MGAGQGSGKRLKAGGSANNAQNAGAAIPVDPSNVAQLVKEMQANGGLAPAKKAKKDGDSKGGAGGSVASSSKQSSGKGVPVPNFGNVQTVTPSLNNTYFNTDKWDEWIKNNELQDMTLAEYYFGNKVKNNKFTSLQEAFAISELIKDCEDNQVIFTDFPMEKLNVKIMRTNTTRDDLIGARISGDGFKHDFFTRKESLTPETKLGDMKQFIINLSNVF